MTGLTVSLKVTPRARRPGVLGATEGGVLRVAVTEPPEDGRANAAVIRLVADALGVPPARCTLVSGATSRQKRIHVEGDAAHLASSLARLPA